MNKVTKIFVGVDVSKDRLDIYFTQINRSLHVNNTDAGIKKFIGELSGYEIECVAFESTGGYEAKMARKLEKVGYQTWLLDPSQVKAFIRSRGVKAKTDAIDAKMIALFASQKERSYIPKPFSENQIKLRALVKRKEALTVMASNEKKRLRHPLQTVATKGSIADMLLFIEKQKSEIELQIKTLIKSDDEWIKKDAIIRSVPGVGDATAAVLISHMPELGLVEGNKIAALIGVAPYTNQSGAFVGKASIYGGRFTVRLPLYMATLTGVRCNSKLKKFYNRLRENGKPAKVALVAAMRKLICIINQMLQDQTYWKEEAAILPVLG
jgi:transposase